MFINMDKYFVVLTPNVNLKDNLQFDDYLRIHKVYTHYHPPIVSYYTLKDLETPSDYQALNNFKHVFPFSSNEAPYEILTEIPDVFDRDTATHMRLSGAPIDEDFFDNNKDNINVFNERVKLRIPKNASVVKDVILLEHVKQQAQARGINLNDVIDAIYNGVLIGVEYQYSYHRGFYHLNRMANEKAVVVFDVQARQVVTCYKNIKNHPNYKKYIMRKQAKQANKPLKPYLLPEELNIDIIKQMSKDQEFACAPDHGKIRLGTNSSPDANTLWSYKIDCNNKKLINLAKRLPYGYKFEKQDRIRNNRYVTLGQIFGNGKNCRRYNFDQQWLVPDISPFLPSGGFKRDFIPPTIQTTKQRMPPTKFPSLKN